MSFSQRFINLGQPDRIWVVSAINGQLGNLQSVHKVIADKFRSGDCLVYTGNYLCGDQGQALHALHEILTFPKYVGGVQNVTFLRGIQEELFSKMMQLQFAQNAPQVAGWMRDNHPELDVLLQAYGSSFDEVLRTSREGIMSLTRFAAQLKAQLRLHDGHEEFFMNLRRAAFTEDTDINTRTSNDNNLLFVHAGLNPHLPLTSQGDSFWWASKNFNDMHARYEPFRTVIRGHDPFRRGVHVGPIAISLDGGCGIDGGKLVCARIANTGRVEEMIAA